MAERRKDMGKLGKHDHKLTNLLKGGIFSLIMLAPLIAIGVRCLYVINNKNAYESYSDRYIENLTLVNTNSMLIEGSEYMINYNSNNTTTANGTYVVYSTSLTDYITLQEGQYITTIYLFNDNNKPRINYTLNDGTTNRIDNWQNIFKSFTIELTSSNTNNFNGSFYSIYLINMVSDKLDNVFDYSLKQLEQQSTFNWVQNTAIYTPLNAMCSGLGITESAIPILLCYWSLMTAIYIVFDIIIYLFTKMTHFIGTN